MIDINSQLRKYFILVAVISVLAIFLLSNLGMNYFFNNYIYQATLKSDQKIIRFIENSYQVDNGFSTAGLTGLLQLADAEEAEIKLTDYSGRQILNTLSSGNMHMHRGGMGRRLFFVGLAAKDDTGLVFQEYLLQSEGVPIGNIEIGRKISLIASAEARDFFRTMNIVFLAALLLSLLLALVISRYVTGKFLRPLLAVKKNIESLAVEEKGRLEPVVSNTREIFDLVQATEELSRTLDKQEKLRKRLTSDIAHELRTPLAILQSHLEALIDGVWEATPQRLSYCNDELIRLTRLINDLNELSGIESDKIQLNITDVNLSVLLESTLENYRPMLMEKEIVIEDKVEKNIWIRGDADRLSQVIVNILSNSYKYSRKNDKITVSLKVENKNAVIEISDTGIGIEAKDIPHIFERFYRGDLSRSRGSGGAGIGLTIAKALVEAHQGSLKIESEPSRGTIATISFQI